LERRITQLIVIVSAVSLLLGKGSYEVLRFPQDTRSLSLHNAASAYDGLFLRNNPAALSMFSSGTLYSYLLLPANIHSGEIQHARKTGRGIGATKLSFINYGLIIDSENNDKNTAFDILLETAYKRELKNIISMGISGGYLFSSIAGYYSQILYARLGVRSRILKKRLGVGFSLENIGFTFKSYTEIQESIPAVFRTALYYRPQYIPVIISADIIRNLESNTAELSGGLEFNPEKQLTIRLGCSSQRVGFLTGDFSSDFLAAVSGGMGFQFTRMTLDVGFMNLGAAGYVVGFSVYKSPN